MLLRLLHGRFTDHEQARLGIVEANISKGLIHFNVNLDLTLSLDDGAPKKTLTLKINTTGYQMIEGGRPLALVHRIYHIKVRVLSHIDQVFLGCAINKPWAILISQFMNYITKSSYEEHTLSLVFSSKQLRQTKLVPFSYHASIVIIYYRNLIFPQISLQIPLKHVWECDIRGCI